MKCWHCSSSSCRLAYFHWVVACCFKKYLFTNRRNSSVYKRVKTQRINPLSFKCPRKGTKMLVFIYIYIFTAMNNFLRYLHYTIIYCFIYWNHYHSSTSDTWQKGKKQTLNCISTLTLEIFCVYLIVAFKIKVSGGMGCLQYSLKNKLWWICLSGQFILVKTVSW